jgi:hypothetical protein
MPRDAEPPNNKVVQPDENLDVVKTSRDQESIEPKGPAGESSPDPHLSVVCPSRHSRRGTVGTTALMAANTSDQHR